MVGGTKLDATKNGPSSLRVTTKNGPSSLRVESQLSETDQTPVRNLIIVAAIAAGVQFGWALQLSLLTPYVQLLGISHKLAPIIWLCGPISGMIVQPLVGYYSDNCTSRFGRRRPFIAAGAGLVAIAVFLIGFAADIGHGAGDLLGKGVPKPRAIAVFIVGFGILDVANNMLQGPCRALLSDLSGGDARKTRMAYAGFSFFMAVGNVLGYAAGAYSKLWHMFPFSKTKACDVYCANLKSCFFISIALLVSLTVLALSVVREKPFTRDVKEEGSSKSKVPFFGEIFGALKNLPKPMRILLLVTCLNWVGWFPFILFDTDWTGREVYGGDVGNKLYDDGVRMGALGLVLNSVVLGFSSLSVEYLGKKVGGIKRLWGIVNFLLAICLALTIPVSKFANSTRKADGSPTIGVKAGALAIFSVLGIPLSATFSIPFALASIFSTDSGSGQGLSLGVLNLAIVVPQMIVSLTAGQWDALFGGGNLPAFVVGAVAAALSGILAITFLPSPPADALLKTKIVGGFH